MIDLNTGWEKFQDFTGVVTEELLKYFAEKNTNEIKFDLGTKADLFASNISVECVGVDMKKLGEGIGSCYDVIGLSFFYVKDTKGIRHPLTELPYGDILMVLASVNDYEAYLTKDRRFMEQTVHFDNESVLITDPTYFLKTEDSALLDAIPDDYDLILKNGWDRHNLTLRQAYYYILSIKQYNELDHKFYKERKKVNDVLYTDFGENLGALGFSNYISRSTIYGDWECTVFEKDTRKKLGEFGADGGMVCVISLKQVLEYNPDFADEMKKCPSIATILENFTGDITYKVDDTKTPDGNIIYKAYLVGEGSVNFKTEQTGC